MSTIGNTRNDNGSKHTGRPLIHRVRGPLSTLSFWLAISIPAIYIPLLVAGIESPGGLLLFLGLLGLHVIALVGGRSHARTTRE